MKLLNRLDAWFLGRIDRKAKQSVARSMGVSYAYADASIENTKRMVRGEINEREWIAQALILEKEQKEHF